jgi:ABC-2 type transport system permease protein
MKPILHIAWREWKSVLGSWYGPLLLGGWAFMGALAWNYGLAQPSAFPLAGLYGNFLALLLFVVPLLTARALADERRAGTLDLLLASPVGEWQIVVGKWLGSLGVLAMLLACTSHFTFWALEHGDFDRGAIAGSYLALIVAGAAFGAWGVACSALCESAVASALACAGGLLLSWFLGLAPSLVPGAPWSPWLAQASVWAHLEPLLRGQARLSDAVFWAGATIWCLALATRALQSRRWE